jgi:hypothetical protein
MAQIDADDEPKFFCLNCYDEPNAWRILWCHGTGPQRVEEMHARVVASGVLDCGRHKQHPAHTWADRCVCSDTNPIIREHRDRMRRHVEKKAERR